MSKKIRFIDCGANVGKAIDWAKNKYKEDLVKIDAFEPEFLNYGYLLKKYLGDDSVDITIHTQAVWTKNIIKKFYIQSWGTRTGSSLLSCKEQAIKIGQFIPEYYKGRKLKFVENSFLVTDKAAGGFRAVEDTVLKTSTLFEPVQCINFSDWILKNLSKEDYNILKIDIEGAEYKVVEHLLNTEAWEYIDEWLVEFTPKKKAPEDFNQEIIDKFKSTVTKYVDWGYF